MYFHNGILILGPALMMKELEKYTENDNIISKSNVDMAKKSTIEDEQVQSKTLVSFLNYTIYY